MAKQQNAYTAVYGYTGYDPLPLPEGDKKKEGAAGDAKKDGGDKKKEAPKK